LPPISSDSFLNEVAASRAISAPTLVDPVKEIARIPECAQSGPPARGPSPWTMLSTPGGSPASAASEPSRCALIGVTSEGFATTQFPAASAGAIFQVSR